MKPIARLGYLSGAKLKVRKIWLRWNALEIDSMVESINIPVMRGYKLIWTQEMTIEIVRSCAYGLSLADPSQASEN